MSVELMLAWAWELVLACGMGVHACPCHGVNAALGMELMLELMLAMGMELMLPWSSCWHH